MANRYISMASNALHTFGKKMLGTSDVHVAMAGASGFWNKSKAAGGAIGTSIGHNLSEDMRDAMKSGDFSNIGKSNIMAPGAARRHAIGMGAGMAAGAGVSAMEGDGPGGYAGNMAMGGGLGLIGGNLWHGSKTVGTMMHGVVNKGGYAAKRAFQTGRRDLRDMHGPGF